MYQTDPPRLAKETLPTMYDLPFEGIERLWLRWYDGRGNWFSTQLEQEKRRADQEKQRADKLSTLKMGTSAIR